MSPQHSFSGAQNATILSENTAEDLNLIPTILRAQRADRSNRKIASVHIHIWQHDLRKNIKNISDPFKQKGLKTNIEFPIYTTE